MKRMLFSILFFSTLLFSFFIYAGTEADRLSTGSSVNEEITEETPLIVDRQPRTSAAGQITHDSGSALPSQKKVEQIGQSSPQQSCCKSTMQCATDFACMAGMLLALIGLHSNP